MDQFQRAQQEYFLIYHQPLPVEALQETQIHQITSALRRLSPLPLSEQQIPQSISHQQDPRMRFPSFREHIYNRNPSSPNIRKLNLVIDLDWTMIYAFRPIPQEQTQRMIDLRIQSLSQKYPQMKVKSFFINEEYGHMIFFIRPNILHFLNSLNTIANLYVCSKGQRHYVRSILQIIDPNKRLFGERIFCASSWKNLEDLGLDKSNTLIFDDDIRFWEVQCQDIIIPSMRFAQVYKEDPNCSDALFLEGMKLYKYFFDISAFMDQDMMFMDSQSAQLDNVCKVIKKIHKKLYLRKYSISTCEALKRHREGKFQEKEFSVQRIENSVHRDTAVRMIRMLGGGISKEGIPVVFNQNPDSTEIAFKHLLSHFFELR